MTCQKKYYNLYFDLLILILNFNLPIFSIPQSNFDSYALTINGSKTIVHFNPTYCGDLTLGFWQNKNNNIFAIT
ncbi:hypothetical protein BpHYR1_022281 [Brachionus plicatilis]|uniref:Uncharacterized protein n=1 Tax=Brachionus plicatilis TaxID=10195 RepID=A0A3M7QUK1_BRAPC|nr:hypothetical protein BpHYR1_022281 [Brachionus plicatilis]